MSKQEQSYETEAYNNGWLDGFYDLVVELNRGFSRDIPRWLLQVIGGKKVVIEAKRSKRRQERFMFDEDDRADYECGYTDGYEDLLFDIKEEYEQKETEMPMFLQNIVAD